MSRHDRPLAAGSITGSEPVHDLVGLEPRWPTTHGVPCWLRSDYPALPAWRHQPESGRARGTVVVLPPVGSEYIASYAPVRRLAVDLADQGFCVIRSTYTGVGDAGGRDDTPDISRWLDDVGLSLDAAVALDAGPVIAVGIRVGAVLLDTALASRDDVDSVLLWHPCRGERFVREERLRQALTAGVPADDDTETEAGGYRYGATLMAGLSGLAFQPSAPARPTLVMADPGRKLEPVIAERSAAGSEQVVRHLADPDFVVRHDVPLHPTTDLAVIAAWIESRGDETTHPVALPPAAGPGAVEPLGVTERVVGLGPSGLCGVLTEGTRTDGGLAVMLNTATEVHLGPNRAWVRLARDLAGHGVRSLRVDLSGLGDSPTRPGYDRDASFVGKLDDLDELPDAVAHHFGSEPVLVGLCSGGYHSLEWASQRPVRAVCAVNPSLQMRPPELASTGQVDDRRRVSQPLAESYDRAGQWRLLQWIARRVPQPVWWALDLLGVYRSPAAALTPLKDLGAPVLLLLGDLDMAPFGRARWRLRSLAQQRAIEVRALEGADHAMSLSSAQRALESATEAFILEVVATADR